MTINMQINEVKIYHISLPFLWDFSHSLRNRSSVNNIVVKVTADHGEVIGYGEGAPRSYVTGESQKTATNSIRNFLGKRSFPRELEDVSQVWDFVDSLPDGRDHNTAICALEMALLDLLGKRENRSIIEYFPKSFLADRITYGAALPLAHKERIIELCSLCKLMGINKLKLKMGKDFNQNEEIVEAIRLVFNSACDIKIDINGVWNHDLAFKHLPLIRDYEIKVVEQPMMPDNPEIADFATMLRDLDVKIMADESACSLTEVTGILEKDHYNMINVRLSKCGGFRKSFRIIDYLRAEGIPFQIACQLGESGLLSAAGRILSLLNRDALYHDGSYDKFLLKENITDENVSFGPGGEAGPLGGCGLGVKIDNKKLEKLNGGHNKGTAWKP